MFHAQLLTATKRRVFGGKRGAAFVRIPPFFSALLAGREVIIATEVGDTGQRLQQDIETTLGLESRVALLRVPGGCNSVTDCLSVLPAELAIRQR